jgi:hypothetical protein
VQIKDGNLWRFVIKDNWDKNREKILCQHLGFTSTGNSVRSGNLSKEALIANGDLECYNTNANGITACCVHLEPSIATGIERSPYPECEYFSKTEFTC